MKALGLEVSDKIFENCILKPNFDPYLCNQSEPFEQGDHPGTIHVEFGQIPISCSREEVVRSFPYIIQCKIVTPRPRSVLTPGA